ARGRADGHHSAGEILDRARRSEAAPCDCGHDRGGEFMKRCYVLSLRTIRRVLVLTRAMSLLDRWASRTRAGLWVRSWLAIYDLEDMMVLGLPWWTFTAIDL